MERRNPNPNNPFLHIAFHGPDLAGVTTKGGGGKQFVDVTPELRNRLIANLNEAAESLARTFGSYPNLPSVMAVKLRESAIAKSHRPLTLVAEAGMTVTGHGKLDEMLVATNADSIDRMRAVIADRNTKDIRCNLSAVTGFVPWTARQRLPVEVRGNLNLDVNEYLRSTGRLWIRLFWFDRLGRDLVRSVDTEARLELRAVLAPHGVMIEELPQRAGPPVLLVTANAALSDEALHKILTFPAIKSVAPEPLSIVEPLAAGAALDPLAGLAAGPAAGAPIVGIFDTGVHPSCTLLAPWIVSTHTYVLPADTDYVHGSNVASIIADVAGLNSGHAALPSTGCRVHDVCGLETAGSRVGDLIYRLREAVAQRPDIRVWNLSFGLGVECSTEFFSELGQELDAISDDHNVLFVVSAGNYLTDPVRGWPSAAGLIDRISSPADTTRGLTVGAVAHSESVTSYVKVNEPAHYSRRGPGPVFMPKPDVVHVGGNAEHVWDPTNLGLAVLAPGNAIVKSIGTSYSAPIVAAMAAQTWNALDLGMGRANGLRVTPSLVKALIIHSAELRSPLRTPVERRYFGSGVPDNPMAVLYDGDDSFTLLFEADLAPSSKWSKEPFPIPAPLLVDGKLKCEVIVTAVYSPPLNADSGAEYIRANVDVGFGLLTPDEDGVLQFEGQVPHKGEAGTDGYESAQIEHGSKWSPVKVLRRVIPQGVTGTHWALRANLLLRSLEPPPAGPLRATIVVTLRAIEEDQMSGISIHEAGLVALQQRNWVSQSLPVRVPINVPV